MRTLRFPKPEKRGPKPPKPLARRSKRITNKLPAALGDHRERVKYANDLWRDLIRAKEPRGICPNCYQRPWHDAAHGFVKGSYFNVRFDLDNGIPLCRVCHRSVDSNHEAKTSLWTRYIGAERYEKLRLRAISRGKVEMSLVILLLEQETGIAKAKAAADGLSWPIRPFGMATRGTR